MGGQATKRWMPTAAAAAGKWVDVGDDRFTNLVRRESGIMGPKLMEF